MRISPFFGRFLNGDVGTAATDLLSVGWIAPLKTQTNHFNVSQDDSHRRRRRKNCYLPYSNHGTLRCSSQCGSNSRYTCASFTWDWIVLNSSVHWDCTYAMSHLMLPCENIKGRAVANLTQFPCHGSGGLQKQGWKIHSSVDVHTGCNNSKNYSYYKLSSIFSVCQCGPHCRQVVNRTSTGWWDEEFQLYQTDYSTSLPNLASVLTAKSNA